MYFGLARILGTHQPAHSLGAVVRSWPLGDCATRSANDSRTGVPLCKMLTRGESEDDAGRGASAPGVPV